MKLQDFVPDPRTGIRVPSGAAAPAGYLDGAEQHLLDALRGARDRSFLSPELGAFIHDWPSEYHLTPYRATTFDAFGFTGEAARVLELGCGCGALTRWLGERCGEVHAIEGSIARAEVARTRCADLDNVIVYAANYSQLDERGTFDVVTLNGVLEYGHLYHPDTRDPHDAAVANLRVARRALREDGVLVLAIENRLGLKYFNGAREDHTGREFDSIEGYPEPFSAVTFNGREMERMLQDAGYAALDWFVPYPDYKLAHTIVNLQEVRDEHHIHNWLDGPAPDRGLSRRQHVAFNETLATREVVRAGLLKELANSHLVLAYAGDREEARSRLGLDTDWVARHYSLGRTPEARKRVTLPAASTEVLHEPVMGGRDEAAPVTIGPFVHTLGPEPFRPGDLLLFEVLATAAAHGVGERFARHARSLAELLVSRYGTGGVDEAGVALLEGTAIDALWWNVVVDDAGVRHVIDPEWEFDGVLPVDYVVWRCLMHFHQRYESYLPLLGPNVTAVTFAHGVIAAALGARPAQRLDEFVRFELFFTTRAAGHTPAPEPESAARWRALGAQPPRRSVVLYADEIAARPALLAELAEILADRSVSLVLCPAPGQQMHDAVDPLREAIAASGVAEDRLPDLLLILGDDDVGALLGATAVLCDRPAPAAATDVPVARLADAATVAAHVDAAQGASLTHAG